jgi:hypothetical protein
MIRDFGGGRQKMNYRYGMQDFITQLLNWKQTQRKDPEHTVQPKAIKLRRKCDSAEGHCTGDHCFS